MTRPVLPPEGGDPRAVARVLNDLLQGKSNNVISVTLTANTTTTTVTDPRLTRSSALPLTSLTANAAAALATTYWSTRSDGSAVLTHANNAQTDRTFAVTITG